MYSLKIHDLHFKALFGICEADSEVLEPPAPAPIMGPEDHINARILRSDQGDSRKHGLWHPDVYIPCTIAK